MQIQEVVINQERLKRKEDIYKLMTNIAKNENNTGVCPHSYFRYLDDYENSCPDADCEHCVIINSSEWRMK